MTTPLDSMDIVAEVIRTHYGFARVGRPEPLPGAHQRRHQKLVAATSEGPFLAKTYVRDPYVLDDLRFQHRLSDHLSRHGLPIAHIQPARNGKRIVEVDDWALELQVFVQGEPMRVTPGTLAIAGGALGRFHEVCRDLPRPPRDARLWRFSEVPRGLFAQFFNSACEAGGGPGAIEQCNQVALFLHSAAKALSIENRDRFETGLIHGDWHGGNMLFHDGQLAAILDLEFAGDGCFLEDLAYAVSSLCIRTSTDAAKLTQRTEQFLHAYEVHRRLSFYERAALFYAAGVKQVASISYQLPLLEGRLAGHNAAEWLERLALQCEWMHERAREIRPGT